MDKKKKLIFVSVILSLLCLNMIFPLLNLHDTRTLGLKDSNSNYQDSAPTSSLNLEGTESVKVITANRTMLLRGTGLLFINDTVVIKNQNPTSISSILIGIPSDISDDLVYLKSINEKETTLDARLTDYIMEDSYQIIEIKLSTPLQSQENRTISILQSFKDLLNYEYVTAAQSPYQEISYTGYVFPLFPYEIQSKIVTKVEPTKYAGYNDISSDGGNKTGDIIEFTTPQDNIDPFLSNVGDSKTISVSIKYSVSSGASSTTKTEMSKLERTIEISPWGIITVRENYFLTNLGPVALNQFKISFPKVAVNQKVSDFFGEVSISRLAADPHLDSLQTGVISMGQDRGVIEPNSTYQFSLKYQISIHNYLTKNFIQQSIRMNLCTSYFQFVQRNVHTRVVIDGCFSVDGSSIQPNGISASTGKTTVSYSDDFITPAHFEDQVVNLTYTVDSFGLLFWPIFYMIVIAAVCVLYIYFVYRRKRKGVTPVAEERDVPVNEIREFCSLYSEKTALLLEIREAESDLKSKKIPKKKYRMLVKKNENKIDAIEEELKPFKETLMETNETFESLVERLEVLETERQTVRDGLNLLDLRYRKGKLPSRSAYMSLKEDFQKRLKKIDRSIDKTIQQLRGYLI